MTEQTVITEQAPVSTEQVSVETNVETQQPQTQETVVDTTKTAPMNTSEVGITKDEVSKNGDSKDNSSFDLNGLVERALKEGITKEEQDQLEAMGMAENFDMIIEGHQARQRDTDKKIQDVAGGKEEYSKLIEFAKTNFNDAEVAAFNQAVLESGNLEIAKLAVEGLKARYVAKNGQEPSKVIAAGSGVVSGGTDAFDSVTDYINETRSMKYRQDPEYAAQVEARRNKSGF